MQLYKRGSIWWTRVDGKRVSTRCRDRKAAELAARALERRRADPRHAAAQTTTLGDAVRSLTAELRRRGRSDATMERARQKCGHWVRLWGETLTLSAITRQLVLDAIDQRQAEGASRTTIRDELAFLRQTLRLAWSHGRTPHDPASILPRWEAQHRPRERVLEPSEVEALLRALTPRRAAHVAFILATGARLGESMRARREDVGEDVVYLRGTKTERARRRVPILPMTRDLLTFALEHAPGNELLFAPWAKLHRDVAAASSDAGIAPSTPNDWRRTLATWLRRSGVEPSLIAAVLGHVDARMVERVYGRLEGAELGAAVEARTVSNLYRAPTISEHPMHSSRLRRPGKTAPPARVELATNALGKRAPKADSAEAFAAEVHGTVLNLYRHFALAKCQWDQFDRWAYEVERG